MHFFGHLIDGVEDMTPKKRGRKARSSFYYTRWYKVGLNPDRAAEVLGVDVETIGQWDFDGNDLAERYLMLWDRKHLCGNRLDSCFRAAG